MPAPYLKWRRSAGSGSGTLDAGAAARNRYVSALEIFCRVAGRCSGRWADHGTRGDSPLQSYGSDRNQWERCRRRKVRVYHRGQCCDACRRPGRGRRPGANRWPIAETLPPRTAPGRCRGRGFEPVDTLLALLRYALPIRVRLLAISIRPWATAHDPGSRASRSRGSIPYLPDGQRGFALSDRTRRAVCGRRLRRRRRRSANTAALACVAAEKLVVAITDGLNFRIAAASENTAASRIPRLGDGLRTLEFRSPAAACRSITNPPRGSDHRRR